MIVLHHIETLDATGTIVIPPFQAGHLGFIPGRHVQTYLLKENENPPAHCEVVVTPFEVRGKGDLVRLVCVMRERPGVVRRLLQALALLNVNVVAQESSTIQHQGYHYISMLIDMSTSSSLNRRLAKDERAEQHYSKELAIAPFHQRRYVELFETIIAYCGDVLTYEDRGLPRLSLRAFDLDENPTYPRDVTIDRVPSGTKGKRGVIVKLDATLINTIKTHLNINKKDALNYFLVSETEYRKLRIIFTKREQTNSLLHVGFSHRNLPGSLYAIMNVLAECQISIVTSVHRSIDPDTSIWEAILWYCGDGFPTGDLKAKLEWLARKMTNKLRLDLLADLNDKDVHVCVPFYPVKNKKTAAIPPIPLEQYILPTLKGKSVRPPSESEKWNKRNNEVITKLAHGIESLKREHDEANRPAIRLLERIQENRNTHVKLFLSYPDIPIVGDHVSKLKAAIRAKFGELFEFDEYIKPNADDILKTVVGKIAACDGFIGIWHEDAAIPISTQNKTFGISPWLPFEFGQAYARSKEFILVRSANVDKRFWYTITPGYSMESYNDSTFEELCIRAIVNWCNDKFVDKWMRDR